MERFNLLVTDEIFQQRVTCLNLLTSKRFQSHLQLNHEILAGK